MTHLLALGIPVALHYPAAVHQQAGYASFAEQSPPLLETEGAVREILTLPLHPWLGGDAVDAVSAAINRWGPGQSC
jgi:dTDP-4-amino-4,6-dideoxygalactose transaminase